MFKEESKRKPIPSPDPLAAVTRSIDAIKSGEVLRLDMDGASFNILNDKFKPQRKEGKLSFQFNSDTQLLTVTDNTAPAPEKKPL